MPPAPKSSSSSAATTTPPSKRPGAPKAKGAVRAKSGCYTCRIRRKKCDEQPNSEGHCSTCVRLRLECLGFGAKRPDWLRENRNVVQLRDKIKNFLASQGMIKGHSGSGARSSDQPNVLRLTLTEAETPPYHSGSSSSPPSRSQTLSNDGYDNRRHPTSNARGTSWHVDHNYSHANGHYATPSEYRSTSPPPMTDYPPAMSSPSHSLQFNHQRYNHRYHPYQRPLAITSITTQTSTSPARTSSFGASYNWSVKDFPDDVPMIAAPPMFTFQDDFNSPQQYVDATGAFYGAYIQNGGTIPIQYPIELPYQSSYDSNELLARYRNDVVAVQYLLGTNHIRALVANPTNDKAISSESQAASLLSEVHYLRFARPPHEPVLPEVSLKLLELERALTARKSLNDKDAMAALHLVSVILFDGGHGKWKLYLDTAAAYVKGKMLEAMWNATGLEKLRRLSEKDAFIVKTAIWFDVLASVTTQERPLLLDIVRMLFKPGQSGLQELSSAAAAAVGDDPNAYTLGSEYAMSDEEKTSMMSPMGCENKVVWALAEISALATWKREQRERGRLSITDLVQRSKEIEKELEVRYHHPVKILSDFNNDPEVYSRYLAAHIFRASATLYLHAVVSDGYPHVTQIKMAVDEVMRWIRRIPKNPQTDLDRKIHKSVIRSTVFAFYITGAMTDDVRYRKAVNEYLLDEAGEVVGNCKITAQILDEIWAERNRSPGKGAEVLWREHLYHGHDPILLV